MRRPVLVSVLLLLATIGYVELRLPVGVGAQGGDAVYTRVAVTSPAAGAIRVAGGMTLGLDLEPQYGGVADRTIVLVNATSCPTPLVLFPSTLQGLGGLITCLYIDTTAAQLGSAILGTSTLQ